MAAINFQLSGKTDALRGRGVPDTSSSTCLAMEQITGSDPDPVWALCELTQIIHEYKKLFSSMERKDDPWHEKQR